MLPDVCNEGSLSVTFIVPTTVLVVRSVAITDKLVEFVLVAEKSTEYEWVVFKVTGVLVMSVVFPATIL
jgi:hypothetical protein